MRKRRTKGSAERYRALFLSHCSCGTILPVRQRRWRCLLCCSPAGYSWDQAERRGEGVANCSLSGSLQPPLPPPDKSLHGHGKRKTGGGGASTVQTLCRLYAQTTWGKLVFGTWQTQNITFCCCSAHYPTSSCLSPPSSAFPNTHHPDTHAHTHTCAHSRKQRTSKRVIA